jgi:hypothetical protein
MEIRGGADAHQGNARVECEVRKVANIFKCESEKPEIHHPHE